MKKQILRVLLCVLMVTSLACIASAADKEYMTFRPYGIYKTE